MAAGRRGQQGVRTLSTYRWGLARAMQGRTVSEQDNILEQVVIIVSCCVQRLMHSPGAQTVA